MVTRGEMGGGIREIEDGIKEHTYHYENKIKQNRKKKVREERMDISYAENDGKLLEVFIQESNMK